MAKPPVDTYDKMINFIQTQLRSKKFVANYQPVLIKLLLLKGTQTRRQIAEELWKHNNSERDTSHYLRVPVYRVLENNGVVTKNGDVFSLVLQNISESEKQSLVDEINSSILRQTNFSKTGYLSFNEAKKQVRQLAKQHNLKNSNDWSEFIKSGNKPDNIPANPSSYYKKKKSDENQA